MAKGNLTSNFTLTTTSVGWRISRWRRRPCGRNCYRRCGRGIGCWAAVAKNGWARYIALRLQWVRKREREAKPLRLITNQTKLHFLSIIIKFYRAMLEIRYDPPSKYTLVHLVSYSTTCCPSISSHLSISSVEINKLCVVRGKFYRKCCDIMSLSLSS